MIANGRSKERIQIKRGGDGKRRERDTETETEALRFDWLK